MRIAVASTMAPPQAICNTARELGVAMVHARANTVSKSLKKTASPAVPLAIQNESGQESGARWGMRRGNSVGPGHNVADAAAEVGTARLQGPGDAVLSERR
jgi:hypothetical protein